jgi:histidinol-phosphate aminotransferase
MEKTKAVNTEGLAFYHQAFRERGLEFVPSVANFILVKVGDGDGLFRKMLQRGIILRAMSSYMLPEWVRISVGTMEQNRRCMEVMDEIRNA